jgi:predicted nucleotidyltransferase
MNMTTQNQQSSDPALSPYGYPLGMRQIFFDDAKKDSKGTYPVVFMGSTQHLPIITVPIELPKYRLLNGRTASSQQEYLALHPDVKGDFFADPERIDVQKVQHQLLDTVIAAGGLKQKFSDPVNKQVEPLILDEFGFVINGNRRLCSWRSLFIEDPRKYGHFSHIDVVILPHSDDKEIDRLEASLQIEKDIRADYTWDAMANMMKQRQTLHQLSDENLAAFYDMKVGEIKMNFEMLRYAEEYLKSRGKENRWSLVSDGELAFRKIVEKRPNLASAGEKELFKEVAFVLIDNPEEAGSRLYDAIPNAQKYIEQIKEKLSEAFPVKGADQPGDDLFGSGKPKSHDVALAVEISKIDNGKKARIIIRDVIEDQKSLIKDAESAGYLLKLLGKANGHLEAAVANALRPDSTQAGVGDQLQTIEAKIKTIRDWLNNA